MLINIPPTFPSLDVRHSGFVDVKHARDFDSLHPVANAGFDFGYSSGVEFSTRLGLLGGLERGEGIAIQEPRHAAARGVVIYGVSTDAVFLGNEPSRRPCDVILDNSSAHVVADNLVSTAKLISAISHIVASRAFAKVSGIDAGRIVARVKNVLSIGNGSVMEFIAKSVGKFLVKKAKTAAAKQAVSAVVPARSPLPTSTRSVFIDLAPKSFIQHMHLHGENRRVVAG